MADLLTLVRRDGAFDHDLRPGEYRQVLRGHMYGELAQAVWRCPACHELASLTRQTHGVDYEGAVTPLSKCPYGECGHQYRITLADWCPETTGRA